MLTAAAAAGKSPELFDLGLANELYAALFAPVDDLVRAEHILVCRMAR